MEVNAGQFATFQCSAIGRTVAGDKLWLQVLSLILTSSVRIQKEECKNRSMPGPCWKMVVGVGFPGSFPSLLSGQIAKNTK